MAKPLSKSRRRTIVLAGAISCIAASLNLLHHGSAVETRYTIYGVLTGMVTAGIIIFFKRRQSGCAATSL